MSEQQENNDIVMESENTLTSSTNNETEDSNSTKVSEKKDKDNDNIKDQKEIIPPIPISLTSPLIKEKPKVNPKRNDDDIEEFDTDEEEENKLEQNNYTDRISYEGDKCIYTEPETGRKLVWNKKDNKWCKYKYTLFKYFSFLIYPFLILI